MIKKYANSSIISPKDILSGDSLLADAAIHERFQKFAADLKRVAPKAGDFLYFSAVMMHAAEAAAINDDGSPKLTRTGEEVKVGWNTEGGTWKWETNDPSVMPVKNANGDIFPESELLKAHKKWIEKPLCVDHKSSSVDAIRGVILDTYYDHTHKRVIALCALDKVNYPDLARKVSTGYSTSVSMGTAVGRAICTENKCHRVARTEQDFCDHMKRKNSYGEINVDLQPIELSIVVNGADPKAKIKNIIASANTLRNSIAEQETELNKLSNSDLSDDKLNRLNQLESDLTHATSKLEELRAEMKEEEIMPPYGMSSGTKAEMDDVELSPTNLSLNLPERLAAELSSLRYAIESIGSNLTSLSNKFYNTKEEIMSDSKDMNKNAYYQGAGTESDPTPGKVRYTADPKNLDLRMHGDRQMLDIKDMGPVDGMFPGDEEKKKLLARAELEMNSTKRAEALQKAKENILNNKNAYYQGAGPESDPTPGKQKYPVEKLNDELRVKFDKQMLGKKPFPNEVVNEKEELDKKKKLLRASFVRAANFDGSDNLGDSAWQVFADDRLILTASVDAITGGRSEALFDSVATKTFASSLLQKIRNEGLSKVAKMYSSAQAAPAVPSADMSGAAPMLPETTPSDAPASDDSKGDMKESAVSLAEEVQNKAQDLTEAVKSLVGEQSEMASTNDLAAGVEGGSVSTASLKIMKKQLNRALVSGMKNSIAELNDHAEELELISDLASSPNSDLSTVKDLTNDAFNDAKSALADANDIIKSFITYSKGSEALTKLAQEERMFKSAENEYDLSFADDSDEDENDADDSDDEDEKDCNDSEDDMMAHDMDDADMNMDADMDMDVEDMLSGDDEDYDSSDSLEHLADMHLEESHPADDMNDADTVKVKVPGKPGEVEVPMGSTVQASAYNLTTKEGRSAYRAQLKLGASEFDFSPILDDAHDLLDSHLQQDLKPSDNLAVVETINQQHQKDVEVALAPVRVRKEAKRIQQLIACGELSVNDLDQLVANGVDAEAVKYWKQYYGEMGSEGKEYASDLLKEEYSKNKFAEELSKEKVKLARAFDLAHDMASKGLIEDNRLEVNAQVEKIMEWNDQAFDSMKRIVAKQASVRKEASVRIPQVGQFNGSSDSGAGASMELEFAAELDRAFSTGKRY